MRYRITRIQVSKPLFHLGDEDELLDRIVDRRVGWKTSNGFKDSFFGRRRC